MRKTSIVALILASAISISCMRVVEDNYSFEKISDSNAKEEQVMEIIEVITEDAYWTTASSYFGTYEKAKEKACEEFNTHANKIDTLRVKNILNDGEWFCIYLKSIYEPASIWVYQK